MYNILLLIFMTIINIIISFSISESVLHPVRLFVAVWSFFILFPILFWDISYTWNYTGLIWIEFAVFFMELGALLGKRLSIRSHSNVKEYYKEQVSTSEIEIKYNWSVMYIIIVLGFMAAIASLLNSGFSLRNVLSLQGLLNTTSTIASTRYSGEPSGSTLIQILSVFTYLSALTGGYSFNYGKKLKEKVGSICAILPMVFSMLFTSGKSGFIAVVILWLAGWCVSYVRINGFLPKIKLKYLLGIIGVFILMMALLFFAMILRTGDTSKEMLNILYNKLWIYAFGQMVEFDGWFAGQESFTEYDLGVNTYMMIFKLLGLVTRKQGVYDIYVYGYGNVFTAFRGVISDFGLFGGLIYCFIRGALSQLCFNTIKNGRFAVLASMLIICSYFWNVYGFIISPWIYTSYVLMILGFGAFMFLFHYKVRFGRLRI